MTFHSILKYFRNLCNIRLLKHKNNVKVAASSPALHTVNEVQYFPLHGLKDLKIEDLKCDKEKWNNIVQEILQGEAQGKTFPQFLSMQNIDDLIECHTKGQRNRYLVFLFKKQMKRAADKEKRRKKDEEKLILSSDKPIISSDSNHIEYGLGKNTLMLAVRKPSLRTFSDKKLANAVLFGQKMVFDMSYDEHMWKKERRDCAAQLRLAHSVNRQHNDPLDLYYCNAKRESRCVQYLLEEMPSINEPLECVTEQSYLDIFPKESLVYLSPHASEALTAYDHNSVYIIGRIIRRMIFPSLRMTAL